MASPLETSKATPNALASAAAERVRELIAAATAPATVRARQGALRGFWAWAEVALGAPESYPVPPEAVLLYITHGLDGPPAEVDAALIARGVKRQPGPVSVATLTSRVAHLSAAHRALGLESPAGDERIRQLLRAARKLRARDGGQRQRAAATLDVVEAMVATCSTSAAADVRDRALLLVGFAAVGRRRSELAALRLEDLREVDGREFIWTVRRSKTDPYGAGHAVPITGRAADALSEWIVYVGEDGPVFRRVHRSGAVLAAGLSGAAVGAIVERRAEAAALDPKRFGAHSLRAGFLTECGQRGISLQSAMELTGHRSPAAALRYHRAGSSLHNPAARLVG